ncbi:hypothetical protein AB0C65_35715 [Nocardia sp. NPDC048505]|uniref:hypothetical protein n=1 Tax=Nocardia sp. NPDC048505 TaxID=3155756 RepID=UPI0033ECD3F3
MSEEAAAEQHAVDAVTVTGKCRFPVGWNSDIGEFLACGEPTAAVNSADGRGHPTGYCSNPDHTRQRAAAARRKIRASLGSLSSPDDLGRPVSHARAQGEMFLDDIRKTVNPLVTSLGRLIEALDGMTDPEAVAEQLISTTKQHHAEVAVLEAKVNNVERANRELREQLGEAEAEAEDSTTKLEVAVWLHAEKAEETKLLAWLHAEARAMLAETTDRAQEAERTVEHTRTVNRELTEDLAGARRVGQELEGKLTQSQAQLRDEAQRATDLEAKLGEQTTRAESAEATGVWLVAEAHHTAEVDIAATKKAAQDAAAEQERAAAAAIVQAGKDAEAKVSEATTAAERRVREAEAGADERVLTAETSRDSALEAQRKAERDQAAATQSAIEARNAAETATSTAGTLRREIEELRSKWDTDLAEVHTQAHAEREQLMSAHAIQLASLTQALDVTRTALSAMTSKQAE